MKVSTKSRYALRFMIELAQKDQDSTTFLKEIAKKQSISEKYLSQIVIPLKRAKLIDAYRGAHGGYSIARAPKDITMHDIVSAFNEDIIGVRCVKGKTCEKEAGCLARPVWQKLNDAIQTALMGTTLEDIARAGDQGADVLDCLPG